MDNSARVKASIAFQAPAVTAGGAALGNTAKSSTTSVSPQEKRAERYEGLSVAREWLYKHMKKVDPSRHVGDVYRTHDCRYVRRERFVGVHFSAEHQSAHYSGLATCGSVWACPVCCALIQQRRRLELAHLIDWAYREEYWPAMVTFTFPHQAFDTLANLRERQQVAFKKLRSGNVWTLFKKRNGLDGLVRSLELTHGENGWHPHTHELWLIKRLTVTEQSRFLEDLKERWYQVCLAAGLVDASQRHSFMLHAVDVRFGVNDSDYLAKQDASRAWGADREIATASSKSGKAKGVHPHEFLIRRDKGDFWRYFEYVNAMKGARQLFWSQGLKARCGLEDIDDKELADESKEPADLLGRLVPEMWALVRRKRQRAQLLNVAESGDWNRVFGFLVGIGWDAYAQ